MFPWSRKKPLVLDLNQRFSWRALTAKPTESGYWLIILVIAVWVGALNYAISLAYALSFWLLSFLLISLPMVRQQLIGLKISRIEYGEVFAGDEVDVTLYIHSETKKGRMFYVLCGEVNQYVGMEDVQEAKIKLKIPTTQRGMLYLPELTLFTIGPFGLMKTQLTFILSDYIVVYPQPKHHDLSTALVERDSAEGNIRFKGENDLSYLAEYKEGESLRAISWKSYAKTGKLLTKHFENESSVNPKLISYKDYSAGISIEQMASYMCQRVLDASQKSQMYTVELPNQTIVRQDNQRTVALNALGLWL